DVRFIENARAAADHGLAVAVKIPGEPGLRREKMIGAVNLTGQVRAEFCELRRTGQIVVGKVAVEVVTQPKIERDVALNPPGVWGVQTDAVVVEAAVRQVVRRLLTAETQAVTKHDLTEREIERIARSTKTVGGCYGRVGVGGADARRIAEETREAALPDAGIRSSEKESN